EQTGKIADYKLKTKAVEELLITMEFRVTNSHGYKKVKMDIPLLEKLLKERHGDDNGNGNGGASPG
ncbi:MAG: hypothetical protein ACXADO_06470, partial [Candidatus Thorarchaeota archaeon]